MAALPPFVRRELEGYLDCGLLCRGYARRKCESCAEQHLVLRQLLDDFVFILPLPLFQVVPEAHVAPGLPIGLPARPTQ